MNRSDMREHAFKLIYSLEIQKVDNIQEQVDLYFESVNGSLKIIEDGVATGYSEKEATQILTADAVTAICDMKQGTAEATAWGCDLTYDYVKINADYRS